MEEGVVMRIFGYDVKVVAVIIALFSSIGILILNLLGVFDENTSVSIVSALFLFVVFSFMWSVRG